MRPWVIAFEAEVFVSEVEYAFDIGVDCNPWQLARGAGKLEPCLVEVVKVEVCVARGVDKLARLQSRHLRHHLQQQRV